MKLWGAIIVFCLAMTILSSPMALAHSYAEDGKISAFLHIDPDDIAKPDRINTIHVYFNDQDGRFTMEGCDCKIKVGQGDKVLLNEPLGSDGVRTGIAKVFLPQNNRSYDIMVSGTPKTAGFFPPFKLKFDIDVGTPPVQPPAAEDGPNLVVRLALAMVIAGSAISFITRRKSSRMGK